MEKRDKPAVDPELKRRIDDLIAYKGGGHNPDLIEDVVENALKLLHDVRRSASCVMPSNCLPRMPPPAK